MAAAVPYIIGMAVFSFVISVCIIILLTKYPKCTVYTMGVLVMLLMLALAAMLFALGNIAGGAIILISLALYCCMLFCFRDKIDIGINLLRISG